jgi:hypothetical protein
MNSTDLKFRFEELSAGRALGDLTPAEESELLALSEQLGLSPDLGFELLAASLEIDALQGTLEPLPDALASRLRKSAAAQMPAESACIIRPPLSVWQTLVRSPFTGWGAAAAILFFAFVRPDRETRPGEMAEFSISAAQADATLRSQATDLVVRPFEGLGDFSTVSGEVTWSDQFQQGYMTLNGIPANDPTQAQYQLWIVDPKRDEAPVDGGVFDIPSDGFPVVVPIAAKLLLTNPQAFVITLEQPGGVVKSKQEKVVALAKN